MFARLLILMISTHINSFIKEGHCAPKLGGVRFEQLLLETFFDNENNTNTYYKEPQAFVVPDSHENIKNTTSLYAKLTGKSKIDVPILRSANEPPLLEQHKILVQTDDEIDGTTNTVNLSEIIKSQNSASSSSPTITEKIKADIASDSDKSKDSQFKLQASEKINTRINIALSPSAKSVRNGATLQTNGYIFNENLCQLKDYRVLCGYNGPRTPTEPQPTTMFDKWTNKDCILREDRIECGYINPSVDKHNKPQDAETTESKVPILRNDTPNPTVPSITPTTNSSGEQPVPTFTKVVTNNSDSELGATTNKKNKESSLAKFKLLQLIDHVKKTFNLSDTHLTSSSTTVPQTVNNANLSEYKILQLINKVIASTFTTLPTIKDSPSTPPPTRTMKEIPPDDHELINRVFRSMLASTITPTNTTTETNLTTTSTSTATATPSTSFTSTTSIPPPPSTSTPAPYIDEREYCIEKDGRIICYEDVHETSTDYIDYDDDYLEK